MMAVCNVSLQIIPLVPEEQVYPTVDRVIELIRSSGVNYTVGPMETTMEGELDRLLEIVKEAQQLCLEARAQRVLSVVKIDYSPRGVTIDERWANTGTGLTRRQASGNRAGEGRHQAEPAGSRAAAIAGRLLGAGLPDI